MLNHLHVRDHNRIAFHGGARLGSPDSKHFTIIPKNVVDRVAKSLRTVQNLLSRRQVCASGQPTRERMRVFRSVARLERRP